MHMFIFVIISIIVFAISPKIYGYLINSFLIFAFAVAYRKEKKEKE